MFIKRRQQHILRNPVGTRRRRPRRKKCGVVDFFTKVKIFRRSLPDDGGLETAANEGRDGGDTSCEIHIDGDYLFVAIALLGAGLAYITYTTITAGRRKRKRRSTAAVGDATATHILLGIQKVFQRKYVYLFYDSSVITLPAVCVWQYTVYL